GTKETTEDNWQHGKNNRNQEEDHHGPVGRNWGTDVWCSRGRRLKQHCAQATLLMELPSAIITVAKILSAGRDHCQRRRCQAVCFGVRWYFLECADLAALWSLGCSSPDSVATSRDGEKRRRVTALQEDQFSFAS